MTPEQHIAEAERLIEDASAYVHFNDRTSSNHVALAQAHIELARYKQQGRR